MNQKDVQVERLLSVVRHLISLIIFLVAVLILLPFFIAYGDTIVSTIQKEMVTRKKPTPILDDQPGEIFSSGKGDSAGDEKGEVHGAIRG